MERLYEIQTQKGESDLVPNLIITLWLWLSWLVWYELMRINKFTIHSGIQMLEENK